MQQQAPLSEKDISRVGVSHAMDSVNIVRTKVKRILQEKILGAKEYTYCFYPETPGGRYKIGDITVGMFTLYNMLESICKEIPMENGCRFIVDEGYTNPVTVRLVKVRKQVWVCCGVKWGDEVEVEERYFGDKSN